MNRKALTAIILVILALVGAGVGIFAVNNFPIEEGFYRLKYHNAQGLDYDKSMFYKNTFTTKGADPFVLFDNGVFYLYLTSDNNLNCEGVEVYKSTDCSTWQSAGIAFNPESASFAQTNIWAPEVVKEGNKYYMFYSACDAYNPYDLQFKTKADFKTFYNEMKSVHYSSISAVESEIRKELLNYNKNYQVNIDRAKEIYQERCEELFDEDSELYKDLTLDEKNDLKLGFAKVYLVSIRQEQMWIDYNQDLGIGLAVADKPEGPFIQYYNTKLDGMDDSGNTLSSERVFNSVKEPYISSEDLLERTSSAQYIMDSINASDDEYVRTSINLIDAHPFVDPETGYKYLYFATSGGKAFISVIQIGTNATAKWTDEPNWNTLKMMSYPRRETINADDNTCDLEYGSITNEAPFVVYKDNKYYLTMSSFGYNDDRYCVIQAISDSPTGPFKKLSREEGGFILNVGDPGVDYGSGTGHHAMFTVGDEMFIVYHQHIDKLNEENEGGQRIISVDRVYFTEHSGQTIIQANGPTYAIQPGINSGYKNLAKEATIVASNCDLDTVKYLNDGKVPFHNGLKPELNAQEFSASSGGSTITLTFENYTSISALMIYNANNIDYMLDSIKRVEFEFEKVVDEKVINDIAVIENVEYSEEYYTDLKMIPGGNFLMQFNTIKVKSIKINMQSDTGFKLGEIVVLGR